MTPLRIINAAACRLTGRKWLVDGLSTAWASWKRVDLAILPSLLGPPPLRQPTGAWEARSLFVVDGRIAPGSAASEPAVWTDGARLSLSVRIGQDARIKGGRLIIDGDLPETVMQAVDGLPIGSLVELPFALDAAIRSAIRVDGTVHLLMDEEWTTLPGPERATRSQTAPRGGSTIRSMRRCLDTTR